MSRDYLLGMAPEEMARLAHQHDAWREVTEHVWDLAAIGSGQTVVDLGSGPGFTTIDLARRVGAQGRTIGVDASGTAIAELRRSAAAAGLARIEAVESDVYSVDLAGWQPDVVTARWLFWVLADPGRLVDRVAAALPSGARLAVIDYCNYHGIGAEPPSPLFDRIFRAVFDSCRDAGGSLDIAGRMPAMMRAAGLRVSHVAPLAQVGGPGTPVWQWVTNFQRIHMPSLVDRGYVSAAEFTEFRSWWTALERNPDALFFAPPMMGVVGVKP